MKNQKPPLSGPGKLGDYPDRDIHCQVALEDALVELTQQGFDHSPFMLCEQESYPYWVGGLTRNVLLSSPY